MSLKCQEVRSNLLSQREFIFKWLRKVCKRCFLSAKQTHNYSLRPLKNELHTDDSEAAKLHSQMLSIHEARIGHNLSACAAASHFKCGNKCMESEAKLNKVLQELKKANTYAEWKKLECSVKSDIDVFL